MPFFGSGCSLSGVLYDKHNFSVAEKSICILDLLLRG
jgi:hypothetical protein